MIIPSEFAKFCLLQLQWERMHRQVLKTAMFSGHANLVDSGSHDLKIGKALFLMINI